MYSYYEIWCQLVYFLCINTSHFSCQLYKRKEENYSAFMENNGKLLMYVCTHLCTCSRLRMAEETYQLFLVLLIPPLLPHFLFFLPSLPPLQSYASETAAIHVSTDSNSTAIVWQDTSFMAFLIGLADWEHSGITSQWLPLPNLCTICTARTQFLFSHILQYFVSHDSFFISLYLILWPAHPYTCPDQPKALSLCPSLNENEMLFVLHSTSHILPRAAMCYAGRTCTAMRCYVLCW